MPCRRDFLKKSGVLAASVISANAVWAQKRRPNAVVMLASGLPDLALDPALRARYLMSLAAESVQFDRSYVSCPETAPSQASLLTGEFPFACGVLRDGMLLASRQPTIAHALKNAGYQIGIFGDWRVSHQKPLDPDQATAFIKQNRANPFFLLVAWPRADAAVVDGKVGVVLQAIDDLQLKQDTVVVFTSDHGYGSGFLESAVRIPLMLRYPVLQPGYRTGVLASNIDIAPTLLGLCGVDKRDAIQGSDLMHEQPQSIYCVGRIGTANEWRMVVQGLDKMVVDPNQNVTNLYNLGADPMELDNRANDPSVELKRDELKAVLNDWMRRMGDGMDPSGLKRRAEAQRRIVARFGD